MTAHRLRLLFPLCLLFALGPAFLSVEAEQAAKEQNTAPESSESSAPLKALLIAGGCCHDYVAQHRILFEGIQARANIQVDVIWTRDKSAKPALPLFENPDWAKGYDIVIHDECAALNENARLMENILKAHETIPSVQLHCAMHSFRGRGNSRETFTAKGHHDWCKRIGLLSTRHGPHVPVSVEIVDAEHPITKPLKDWVTGKEELYNNAEIYDAEPLAMGTQTYMKNGKEITDAAIVAWVNTKSGALSFSTSLGHYNEVVESDEYLDLVTRGTLWACGKLDDPDYHTPYTGTNAVREIELKTPAE